SLDGGRQQSAISNSVLRIKGASTFLLLSKEEEEGKEKGKRGKRRGSGPSSKSGALGRLGLSHRAIHVTGHRQRPAIYRNNPWRSNDAGPHRQRQCTRNLRRKRKRESSRQSSTTPIRPVKRATAPRHWQ